MINVGVGYFWSLVHVNVHLALGICGGVHVHADEAGACRVMGGKLHAPGWWWWVWVWV
jgi:hypothetical protein